MKLDEPRLTLARASYLEVVRAQRKLEEAAHSFEVLLLRMAREDDLPPGHGYDVHGDGEAKPHAEKTKPPGV